jgi:hypothetical protein
VTRAHDRDAVVDRLLAATPRDQGEPTEDCLEADTIAALADGGLSAGERGVCMDHVASCSHCQAVLAALIQTAPEPASGRAWWRLRPWPWLVPALGGATALLLWVAVERQPVAVVSRVPTPVAEPSGVALTDRTGPRPAMDPLARKELDRQLAVRPMGGTPAPPSSPRQDAEALAPASPRVGSPAALAGVHPAAPAMAAPTMAPPPAALPGNAALPAATPPAEAPGTAPTSPQRFTAAGPASQIALGRAAPASPAPPQLTAPPAPAAVDALAREAAATASPIDIRSSDPRVRWRIAGNAVEHSTDGGVTWAPQAIGASARLTAGSAPLPEVCWIVGDDGTVVVTADGLSWTRLPFPQQVPLASVNATSADAASVTTRDGRVFTTTDRGRTWR